MKKLKLAFMLFFLILGLSMLFANGTISHAFAIVTNPTNYVIVCPDNFYGDSVLSQYIKYKQSQGYNVEVRNVSNIYSQYPISFTLPPLLQIKNIEEIDSTDFLVVYVLWNDGTFWGVCAYNYTFLDTPFKILTGFSSYQNISISVAPWTSQTSGYVKIVHDGGQAVTVNVVCNGLYDYGMNFITASGQYCWIPSGADSIRECLNSYPNLEYVTLLGNLTLIPSFPFRAIASSGDIHSISIETQTSVSDTPYATRDLNSMYSDYAVGRIPVGTIQEMEMCLVRDMNYSPDIVGKSLFLEGPNTGIDGRATYETTMNQTFNNIYENYSVYDGYIPSTVSDAESILSNEHDVVLFLGHGEWDVWEASSDINYIQPSFILSGIVHWINPSIILTVSCSTCNLYIGKLGKFKIMPEAFMTSSYTNAVAYVGYATWTGYNNDPLNFFSDVAVDKTLGKTFIHVRNDILIDQNEQCYERMNLVLMGDPTLILTKQSQSSYGTLSLEYYVNGYYSYNEYNYTVIYPNGTKQTYFGPGSNCIIYNAPAGTYTVICVVNSTLFDQETVKVDSGKTSDLIFTFPNSNTTVYFNSNVEPCFISINGYITDQTAPFYISLPAGTYIVTAIYDNSYGNPQKIYVEVQNVTLTLTAGESLVYTFQFANIIIPQPNYWQLFLTYSPFVFLAMGAVIGLTEI